MSPLARAGGAGPAETRRPGAAAGGADRGGQAAGNCGAWAPRPTPRARSERPAPADRWFLLLSGVCSRVSDLGSNERDPWSCRSACVVPCPEWCLVRTCYLWLGNCQDVNRNSIASLNRRISNSNDVHPGDPGKSEEHVLGSGSYFTKKTQAAPVL